MSALAQRFRLVPPAPEPEVPLRVLPDAPTAPAAAPVVAKINFGAAAKKKAKGSKEYPELEEATDEVKQLAESIRKDQQDFDSLEGALKENKGELRKLIRRDYFDALRGDIVTKDTPNGLRVRTPNGGVLLVATSKYPMMADESGVSGLLALPGLDTKGLIRPTFEIKLKSENLPQDPAMQQNFVNELIALLAKFKSDEALEVKQGVVFTDEFHTRRHTLYTIEQNLALDTQCGMVVQIKSKGIK